LPAMLSSLFARESALGMDIGSHCIKAVEISTTSRGWELVNAAVTPCPKNAVKDGVIVNILEVSHAIKAMLKEAGIRTTGTVCGISGSQVIVRQVQFPRMPESALRKSIKYEASKYISSSVEDSVTEFEIIGDSDDPAQMNVWLVAAPREMVDTRVSSLESVGLEPLAVDIEAFALIRSLVEFSSSDKYLRETVALVDMGACHTDVNVLSKGEFALTRNIPIAGDSFTNAIKSLTGGSYEEAEQMKLDLTKDCPLDQIGSAQPDNRTWKVIQPLLDELIREIKRSINFYHSQFPEGSVEQFVGKIVLTGGSARMPGMDAYIASKLSIPTEIADVFKQSAIATSEVASGAAAENGPVLTVGIGLALKELAYTANKKAA
jgi:type IV pilus assembly protein PilM